MKNKKVMYALIALVVVAAMAGIVVYRKKQAAKKAGATPLAAKQTKTFEIKKSA